MALVLNGDGNVTGLTAGGLPDASITQSELAYGVAGNGPAFSAYTTSVTYLPNAVWTKTTFDTKEYDTNTTYSTSTSRFTPNVAGYYLLSSTVAMSSYGGTLNLQFYKNGTAAKAGTYAGSASWISATAFIPMNGTTDYIEVYTYQSTGYAQYTANGGVPYSFFQGVLIRAL